MGIITRYNTLFLTRFGLLATVLISCLVITHNVSAEEPQHWVNITIIYANNTLKPYTVSAIMNENHVISQRYVLDNADNRFSLTSYSIDNGPKTQIARHHDGNFTLDVLANKDHMITFFSVQQFAITSTEKNTVFFPSSPTADNWFDIDSEVRFIVPYVIPVDNDTRKQLVGWSLDNSDVSIIPRLESGSFRSTTIHMSANHIVSPEYKNQYHVNVISNFGQALGTGWYDSGTIANISVIPGDDMIVKHSFVGWQGQVIGDGRQYAANIMVDSPKVLVANWLVDYTNMSILSIIVISIVVLLAIYQKRKIPTKT